MYNLSLIEQYVNISWIDEFDGKDVSEIYDELIDNQKGNLYISRSDTMDAAQQIFEYLTEDEQAINL